MANRVTVVLDVVADKATASWRNFRTAVQDADGTVNKFKTGANAAMDSVKQNAGNMALAAGAALVTFGVKAVGAFQELALAAGKFSEATGIAVEDASRFIEVAGDLGIESGTVEAAIARMNKSLADGKAPTDDLTAAIKRGADGNIDSKETFIELITQIGKIKDPTLRAKAAQETFGRSYTQLAEMMGLSADELREKLSDVADEKIVDERELDNARDFRDALDNLRDNAENLTLEVGGALIPAMTGLAEVAGIAAEALRKVGLSSDGWLAKFSKFNWDLITYPIRKLDEVLSDTDEASENLGYSFGILGEKARRAESQVEEYGIAVGDVRSGTQAARERLDQYNDELERNVELIDDVTDELYGYETAQLDVADAVADMVTKQEEAAAAAKDEELSVRQKEQAYRDSIRAQQDAGTAAFEAAQKYAQQKGAVEGTDQAIGYMIEELERQKAKYPELAAEIDKHIAKLRSIPATVTTNVKVTGGGDFVSAVAPGGRRATGGIGHGVTLVGEQGPELVDLGRGGAEVFSAGRTQQMLQGGGGAAGGAGLTINMYGTSATPEQVVSAIRQYERRNGTSWRS